MRKEIFYYIVISIRICSRYKYIKYIYEYIHCNSNECLYMCYCAILLALNDFYSILFHFKMIKEYNFRWSYFIIKWIKFCVGACVMECKKNVRIDFFSYLWHGIPKCVIFFQFLLCVCVVIFFSFPRSLRQKRHKNPSSNHAFCKSIG